MKKIIPALIVIGILLLAGSAAADSIERAINTFNMAKATQPFFEDAYGYAVFPTIGKGGLGVGGAYGKGRVYRNGVATGNTSIVELSVGAQLGGQAYSQIIFFEDQRAYEDFTGGNFEFAAGASAVAITIGAQAQSTTTGNSASAGTRQKGSHYKRGMAVFIHAKGGFMAEATLAGQKYAFEPLEKQ